jgi:hypothetical protein
MKSRRYIAVVAAWSVVAVAAVAQTPIIGSVRLAQAVLADGKPLPAGTYDVRLTTDEPKPAVGQSPGSERWVEFVKGGQPVGREVATIVSNGEIDAIANGPRPKPNGSRVDVLKGGDFVRVWINRDRVNYIIHLTPVR